MEVVAEQGGHLGWGLRLRRRRFGGEECVENARCLGSWETRHVGESRLCRAEGFLAEMVVLR